MSSLSDRRITLEQLRAFVNVAESGGFNNAGARLGRSQSAVTQSVQKLEEYLECYLLERRQGHVLGLTTDGRRLLPEARKILLSLDNVVSVLRRPELSGHISLGISNNFNAVELQMAVASCLEMNKGLRVEVVSSLTGQLAQMLEQGALDLAILHTVGELGPTDRLLKEESLHWVAANPEAVLREEELPLVLFGEGCAYHKAVVRVLEEAGMKALLRLRQRFLRRRLRGHRGRVRGGSAASERVARGYQDHPGRRPPAQAAARPDLHANSQR